MQSDILNLNSPISEIKGFGPKKTLLFKKLGIETLSDFLMYFPREYQDFRNIKNICNLKDGENALIEAVLMVKKPGKGYGIKRTLHLYCSDRSGAVEIIFFMAGYMEKNFTVGEKYRFYGKIKTDNGKILMFHPSWYPCNNDTPSGIQPVYKLCAGLTQKDLKNGVLNALDHINEYGESLPEDIVKKFNLYPIDRTIENIHFPVSESEFAAARYRVIFEELFRLKCALLLSENRFGKGREGISFKSGDMKVFVDELSYELTDAQTNVLSAISEDMDSKKAMNRLVQGDVGSGKTVIAEAAMYKAVKAGYQAAFMAPTEILARQHYDNLREDFCKYGITVDFLAGSLSAKERKETLCRLKKGQTDIVIGTHAIISQNVDFDRLGLVITDEQHRFGVNQRKQLSDKAENPDVLVMTATPIPRTLAVVLYSDLDISVIDQLPPGRKPIITNKYDKHNRKDAYRLLETEIQKGRQAYIVAPLIEDSESLESHSAEGIYESFTKKHPDISCALLHGQMSEDEKNHIMSDFSEGRISVLISTVVIEVGINVPNASVMLIENSERFGLAQMHQLRGRVGRGIHQSFCLIINEEESELSKDRADIMCSTSDGFKIAEKDLELRGPGDIFGYRQHGLPEFKFADPVKHARILSAANQAAKELISMDPALNLPENKKFGDKLRSQFASQLQNVL